jgi:predicted nucleic-acid-binding protein
MRVGLDTSVLLRLLVGEPQLQADAAWQAILEVQSGGGEAVVSDLVVSEAYFALQHHYDVPKHEALMKLRSLFARGDLVSSGCAAQVLSTPGLATGKPGFMDRMIHADYARSADRMLTFERAARKLPHAQVLKG